MLRGFFLALLLAVTVAACGDDDDENFGDVGAPCESSAECRGRCARGGDFPGGMCTYECARDEDCPRGTACVSREGGICAVICERHSDCEGFGFDSSYGCFDTDRRGAGGDVRVCRAD